MAAQKSFKAYEGIVAFLILEVLALTTFGLGGLNYVFHIAGFLVALFSFLTSSNQFKKGELIKLLVLIVPLFIFAILVSVTGSDYFEGQTLSNICTILGVLGFFFMGLTARRNESFNIETALICIGGGLALLVLINTIATWFDYGPFYPLIYSSKPDGYYRGEVINLTKEMNVMVGLKFYESTISYGSQYAILLATSIPALFFIDRKKETKKFLIVSLYAVISILALATVTSLNGLIFLAIILVAGVVYKFFRDNDLFKKMLKWAFIVILGLASLVLLLVILNCLGDNFFSRFVASNSFMNRLFNTNNFITSVNEVLRPAFKPYNLFGFKSGNIKDVYGETYDALLKSSGHFELEIVKEGGIFALVALVVFGVFVFFSTKRYLVKSHDSNVAKVVILCFLITFVLYYSFSFETFPLIHVPGYLNSFSRFTMFMVCLFIIGYTANAKGIDPVEFEKKEKKAKESLNGVSAVEEYDFSDSDQEEKQ